MPTQPPFLEVPCPSSSLSVHSAWQSRSPWLAHAEVLRHPRRSQGRSRQAPLTLRSSRSSGCTRSRSRAAAPRWGSTDARDVVRCVVDRGLCPADGATRCRSSGESRRRTGPPRRAAIGIAARCRPARRARVTAGSSPCTRSQRIRIRRREDRRTFCQGNAGTCGRSSSARRRDHCATRREIHTEEDRTEQAGNTEAASCREASCREAGARDACVTADGSRRSSLR